MALQLADKFPPQLELLWDAKADLTAFPALPKSHGWTGRDEGNATLTECASRSLGQAACRSRDPRESYREVCVGEMSAMAGFGSSPACCGVTRAGADGAPPARTRLRLARSQMM